MRNITAFAGQNSYADKFYEWMRYRQIFVQHKNVQDILSAIVVHIECRIRHYQMTVFWCVLLAQ